LLDRRLALGARFPPAAVAFFFVAAGPFLLAAGGLRRGRRRSAEPGLAGAVAAFRRCFFRGGLGARRAFFVGAFFVGAFFVGDRWVDVRLTLAPPPGRFHPVGDGLSV
jgi:hypothetical protein